MRTVIITALISASCLSTPRPLSAKCATQFDHTHQQWTELLRSSVSIEGVNYRRLRMKAANLDSYLSALENVCPNTRDNWPKAKQLAYWINVYNAYTVKLILNHYPIKSIRKIGVLSPWKRRFIPIHALGETELTLDEVEHTILRKKFSEARIHFAVNCASVGCPPLFHEAFTAEQIESQLDKVTRAFLSDTERNLFEASSKLLKLSKIFDWFKEDFVQASGSVRAFVGQYIEGAGQAAKVEFLDYDWSLNEAP